MTDHLSKEKRSWNMSRIRSKNTKPELKVRSLLHKLGYRFRLNGRVSSKYYKAGILPGKPDIVLAKYKTVIFIHGCFWHRHEGCKNSTVPKTRTEWWLEKFNKNVERDINNQKKLKELGWKVIVIWECEIKDRGVLREKVSALPEIKNLQYIQEPTKQNLAADGKVNYNN